MNVKNFFFALNVAVSTVIALTDTHKASALTWSIGTSLGASTSPNYYHGQSFTPTVLGPSGSGTPGATAYLQSFTFGPSSSGNLYIYSNPYNGTPSGLISGSGLIGVSSTADNSGTYNFGNGGLLLSSVSSQFYAYTDSSFNSLYRSTNPYPGGYYFYSSGGNFSANPAFDWNFSANFKDTPTQAVPWNIEPGQGVALGLPLFIGLRMLKKRRALKKSTREVQQTIRS